jgi:hypothetical protein
VAFALAEYRDGAATERTPEGRLISDDEYWEGLVFYRGDRYDFIFPRRPTEGPPPSDYVVVGVHERQNAPLWSLRDHPRLVLDVLGMKRARYLGVDADRLETLDGYWREQVYGVNDDEMRAFLNTYGPLTPSFQLMPDPDRISEAMIDEMSMHERTDAAELVAGRFSVLVNRLHAIASVAKEDALLGVVRCLGAVYRAPPRSLYQALLLQLLGHLLSGAPLNQCKGCGKWFSFTEDDTQARHRNGWKRRDASYHSRACLKATSERNRRARRKSDESRP